MLGALKRIKNGRLYLIVASDETSGHLTTGNAKFFSRELTKLLEKTPRQGM
jgi:homoserine O-acetyltransferase